MPFDEPALWRLAMGALINLWRERVRKISQTELEEAAGLSSGRVSDYERGEAYPEPENLERIAGALGLEPQQLRAGAEAIVHHLAQGLGPLEATLDYPPHPPHGDAAEPAMPEDLRSAWDWLLDAEHRLARARQLLENDSFHRPPRGGPPSGDV